MNVSTFYFSSHNRDKELKTIAVIDSRGRPTTVSGDLRLVGVRDGEGRTIRGATTVDIYNRHKDSIKSYPVLGKWLIYLISIVQHIFPLTFTQIWLPQIQGKTFSDIWDQ